MAPEIIEGGIAGPRKLFRQFLIDFDAPAGRLIGVAVAIFNFQAALENILGRLVEDVLLLDAEVLAYKIQSDSSGVPNRRIIPWAMPGRTDAEWFAKVGESERGKKTADL